MTQQNKQRIGAVLASVLGLLSIKEGGGVLLGITTKTYTVLPWLVWYNVVAGFLSVLCGRGLWLGRTWADKLADTIVTLHGLVLLNLIVLFAFHEAVAKTSIMAMLFRTVVWIGILMLTRWKIRGKEVSKEQ
jgi:hypothetical protein